MPASEVRELEGLDKAIAAEMDNDGADGANPMFLKRLRGLRAKLSEQGPPSGI